MSNQASVGCICRLAAQSKVCRESRYKELPRLHFIFENAPEAVYMPEFVVASRMADEMIFMAFADADSILASFTDFRPIGKRPSQQVSERK